MGHIKEPPGINFVVDSTPVTEADRRKISEVISYYKATGRKMPIRKTVAGKQLRTKKVKK